MSEWMAPQTLENLFENSQIQHTNVCVCGCVLCFTVATLKCTSWTESKVLESGYEKCLLYSTNICAKYEWKSIKSAVKVQTFALILELKSISTSRRCQEIKHASRRNLKLSKLHLCIAVYREESLYVGWERPLFSSYGNHKYPLKQLTLSSFVLPAFESCLLPQQLDTTPLVSCRQSA